MTHVAEGVLQAWLDGELRSEEGTAVAAHLDACSRCAAELELLRTASSELSAALALVDAPAPMLAARHAIALRSRPAAAGVRRPARPTRPSLARPARQSLLRAAGLILALAGLAGAAIPGSPVREWIVAVWNDATEVVEQPVEPTAPARSAPAEPVAGAPAQPAGISILPLDGRVWVALVAPDPGSQIQVRIVDAPRVSVEALGPAAAAQFRTGPGTIAVENAGAGVIRIDLPRALEHARIEVDGRPYLLKIGSDVRVLSPPGPAPGPELILRATP